MTAIWPAGPPKLSAATLSHTQNASLKDGSARGTELGVSKGNVSEEAWLIEDMVRP